MEGGVWWCRGGTSSAAQPHRVSCLQDPHTVRGGEPPLVELWAICGVTVRTGGTVQPPPLPPPIAERNNGRSELSATQREKHPKHRKHRRCVTSSTCSLLLSPPCPPFCPPPHSTEGLSPQPPSARPRLSPVSPQWVQCSAAELPPPQRSVWGCGAVSSPPHPHLPVPEGQGWGGLSQSCISPPRPPTVAMQSDIPAPL